MQRRRTLWSALGWAFGLGMALAIAMVFVQTPLLNTLGYEAAAALAVLGSLAGLLLAATAPTAAPFDAKSAAVTGAKRGAAGLLIVIASVGLRGLWHPTCDLHQAMGWLALLPLPSLLLGAAAGATVAYVVSELAVKPAWRPAVSAIVALLVWLAIAGSALWRVYHHPTARSYSPWVGYFPGNLYDELIEVPAALWWARLEQGAWALAALAACAWHRQRRVRSAITVGPSVRVGRVALASTACAIALASHSGAHEYRLDRHDIARALGGVRENEHFSIYYEVADAEVAAAIDDIAREHEFRLDQVKRVLAIDRLGGKIRSFYFSSPAQKTRWFGARYTEMARPWQREIFLAHAAFPHPSLRHEIAHVVAGELGDPWFAVSSRRWHGLPILANPGVIEGSAVMADWPGSYGSELTPHQATAVLQQLGWAPSASQLMSLAFFGAASAQGYTSAGSLMRYVHETHGVAAWQALYRNGGDTQAALQLSLSQLEANWRQFLAGVALPDGAVEAVRERYARPSVFVRRCPHDVAALMETLRTRTPGEASPSGRLATLHAICNLMPTPDMMLALGQWSITSARALAIGYFYQVARNPGLDAGNRGEAYWHLTILALEGPNAQVLVDEALRLHLPLVWRRRMTMLDAIVRGPTSWRHAILPYLFAEISAAPRPSYPLVLPDVDAAQPPAEAWLGPYLRMRDAAVAGDDARVLRDAPLALAAVKATLYRGALGRFIVEAAWRAQDDAALALGLSVLAEAGQSAMDRHYGEDWQARRDFYGKRLARTAATSPQQ
ncbi:MAG: hypothetical protein IPL79_05645 [Myxococcales bacterium]|nr:hypothetical protein [Myxococcales bacterium]